jgi:hypothetical protein
MANLRVYNVGHGEAMCLGLDNDITVIRDFGRFSNAIPTNTSITMDRIIECCMYPYLPGGNFGNIDAALSHAHDDHFNGFIKLHNRGLRKIFRNSYIPWLDFATVDSMGGVLLQLTLYLYTYYDLQNPDNHNARNWIKIAPIMLELSENLYGTCSGYTINTWSPQGQVLWPPPPGDNYYTLAQRKIAALIRRIEDRLVGVVDLNEFKLKIYQPLFNILKRSYPENVESPNSSEENQNNVVESVSTLLSQADTYRQSFRQIRIENGIILSHRWTLDDHSLVFQLVDDSGPIALFLSDLTSRRINQMLNYNGLNNIHYSLLKSAHHGSRYSRGLYNHQISSERVLHCCGPANKNWRGPDTRYATISNQQIFTDWNQKSARWHRPHPYYRDFLKCCEVFTL